MEGKVEHHINARFIDEAVVELYKAVMAGELGQHAALIDHLVLLVHLLISHKFC